MSTIDSTSQYKFQGTVYSLKEMADKNPEMVIESHAARLMEHKVYETQMMRRGEAVMRLAEEHPPEIYGQVTVNGKLVATVWDDGAAQTPGPIPGLTNDGSLLEIAKARVQEIARALGGEVRYSNFLTPPHEHLSGDKIPDTVLASLPPITARRFELDEQMLADLMRSQTERLAKREAESQSTSTAAGTEVVNNPE